MVEGPDAKVHKSDIALCVDGTYKVTRLDTSGETFTSPRPIVRYADSSGQYYFTGFRP